MRLGILRFVAWAWLCGCATTSHWRDSTAEKEARASELLRHNADAKCVLLDATELARARRLTLSNASSFPAMYGELTLSTFYERTDEPLTKMSSLEAYSFTEWTREQVEAAERERAGVESEEIEPIRVEAIADDGTVS